MSKPFPTRAQVVIVGGGVMGCSLAYHLTKRGWKDVVLLERKSLTSGTTWHAAGLIVQLRPTLNMTRLAQYTARLYRRLEEETGQATGYRQTGGLTVARTAARMEELQRAADMGHVFGVDVEVVGPSEIKRLWPMMEVADLAGGIYIADDGQTSPTDTTMALAKGARDAGAAIFEHTKVTRIDVTNGRVTGVGTSRGDIEAEYVVNCAGMWARELGRLCGVNVPLQACEHYYIVTDPIEGLPSRLPVTRDPDGCAYYKEDAGRLLVGAFEPEAKPWGTQGIPEDFEFDSLPPDYEHLEPILLDAMQRVPALETAGIRLFFCGPESFTPDGRYMLGPAPELANFFVAAGFNSMGLQSAGGAGKVLADWIVDGHPPMDLWDVDLRRMVPFQGNGRYLRDRVVESLGLLHAMHWPFRQYESARDVRRSPLHERLAARGACFGEAVGWERPNWYAPAGVAPRYAYSWGRQNWFAHSAAEHRAVREGVGLFDQTSFAKFMVQGRDAEAVLNRICSNNVAVPPGKVVYTQWLNPRGGIEADLTVSRLAEEAFMVVTAPTTQTRDFAWLQRHIPADACAVATDVTSAYAVLGVMGPRSRELLATVTDAALSNEAFPFATSQEISIGYAQVRALRITYVGELGWELYLPSDYAVHVYDTLVKAGEAFGLRHAGFHALHSLRLEKGYRSWGHDITDEDNPLEAGLGFAVAWNKNDDFIGREALARVRAEGVKKRLVQFKLEDPAPLVYHNEPIWRDGRIASYVTSGMYGHSLGRAVCMGFIGNEGGPVTADYVNAGRYEIQVNGVRYPAEASLKPFLDPKNERVKA